MAIYQIVETPGKRVVYPTAPDDMPLNTQDKANIKVAELRSIAKAEGRKHDYVVQRVADSGSDRTPAAGSSGGTSIRLSEEARRELAKHCGRIMAKTGDSVNMGTAVMQLVALYQDLEEKALTATDGVGLSDDGIIKYAKRLIKARKEAEATAETASEDE